jgi:hypothetical protein
VRRLGFTWTRLHDCSLLTKWFATEPEPGQFSWHDDVAAAVRKGGLNILGLADDAPKWAETPGGTNVIDLAAWGRYCEAIARRYRGTIDHWEIWNEPYMPRSFLDGTQQQFGEAMQVAHAAFKRGNPDCKVLGWCTDITNPKWGAQIPPEARACIDAFTFHNYIYSLCGGGTLPLLAELPEHRKQFGSNTNKECWNSEGTNGELPANSFYTFLPSPLFSADKNARAAAFASRVWLEQAKVGVDKFFVYTMHNVDSPMYMGGYMSLMISYDRSPTPAAVACATTAYAMDGLRSVPFVPVAGVVQSLFSGPGRATWAVYDDAGVTGRLRLDLRRVPKDAEVFDVMGNDPRRNGRTAWDIGIQPLFVLSARLNADELAAAGQAAIRD